jgi:hypothetical protein
VAMTRPGPVAGASHEARSNRIHVPVAHDRELVPSVGLDSRGTESLHDHLAAGAVPPVEPPSKGLVHHLPERAEGCLSPRGTTDDVGMGPHEAIAVDLDSVHSFVLREEFQEPIPRVVRGEDEGVVVTSPEAMIRGVLRYEP